MLGSSVNYPHLVEDAMCRYDMDGSGLIEEEEFVEMMWQQVRYIYISCPVQSDTYTYTYIYMYIYSLS